MTPADLSLTVLHAVRRAVDEGALRVGVPARVKVERPRPGGTGDYASSVALSLARPSGLDARAVAAILKERLHDSPGVRSVDITGPGFLNFTLEDGGQDQVVREILAAGALYGHSSLLSGQRIRLRATDEPRARLLTETVLALLRSQGADARLDPAGERIPVLPAPYEPHLLGTDAARWALLRPAAHDRALSGAPLLVQHERNPLFRVRYAHARSRALLRNGAQLGISAAYAEPVDAPDLLTLLGDHPDVLASAARHRAPDRVARHLEGLADAFLAYQHTVLPLGDEKPSAAHRSRLALAEAAGTVLAGGLSLLGISAPDQI
ncbi:arginine--tRNA ligase [Streptomyces sp. SKN60]|uniref:ArgS-related anticodon-binding protein NrtL n=1 Tax=Streptomyces sp. SKN60 TaxID=2855506 RepID=UPI002247FA8D|nr:DALR anticodon-binding domain-containing protein [Streptomyces sp. SKN60]MCX2185244.1 arginine--tRNA ligase [Streptomyces sp. SKN60]